ncbi:hypothetical protein DFO54_11356 [Erwinia sp. AG740]|nr:hypothetical protein DFO54_11356 [Erwinia sp. AG740]
MARTEEGRGGGVENGSRGAEIYLIEANTKGDICDPFLSV